MAHKIDFNFCDDETLRCRGKPNTDKRNCEGEYFGNILINEVLWALVLWDDDEDPDLYKASCILVEETAWVSIA